MIKGNHLKCFSANESNVYSDIDPDGLTNGEETFELFAFIMLFYYYISPYSIFNFALPIY